MIEDIAGHDHVGRLRRALVLLEELEDILGETLLIDDDDGCDADECSKRNAERFITSKLAELERGLQAPQKP